jgi:dTDP-4-amino-4,6-dideoxygalactose transaminase
MAWDIGPGDAVFVPDFTFIATAEVVALRGATPIFVDINERTFNMDANDLEKAILEVIDQGDLIPKVVIPVDLYGLPADYPAIEKIAKKHNLLILEDAAQGFGGSIDGKKTCSFGDAATTSFFPAKPLGCYGDGGAIFTNDKLLAEALSSLRVHGKGENKYDNIRIGTNSRLDTLQASILIEKLKVLDNEIDVSNKISNLYNGLLTDRIVIPFIPEGYYSSFAQYTILLSSNKLRNEMMKYLNALGIPTTVFYPKVMHQQVAFKYMKDYIRETKVSLDLSQRVLSIPIHPYLTNREQRKIIKSINNFFNDVNN